MKSFTVKNYKNLKDFHIDGLKRVNLIVGKNNVGKTSLLEAISIFSSGGDFGLMKSFLVKRRTLFSIDPELNTESSIRAFASLYTNFDRNLFLDNPIEFFESTAHRLKIQLAAVEDKNITGRSYKPTINAIKIDQGDGDLVITHRFIDLLLKPYQIPNYYVYGMMSSNTMSPEGLAPIHDQLVMDNLEEELVKALNIIEPRIRDVRFLTEEYAKPDFRLAYAKFEGHEKRIKLSNMGEGTNRILAIILAMLNCKGGIFLLDEFDNGLHHSVQSKLWSLIFELAERFDIQVFATTHSNDCVRSFASIAQKKNGKLIRLQNRRDEIIAVSYDDADEFSCIATSDIETR